MSATIEHHIGLAIILIAWILLIYHKLKGDKIYLPGYFFFLYGIGVLLISYSMWRKKENVTIVLLEAFIGITSIILNFV